MVVSAPVDRDRALYDDGQVGVYLHLPFCERICPYCDFAVVAARPLGSGLEARYVSALRAELELRRDDFAGRSLASLYFGGGTPSLFAADSIRELIDAVHQAFEPGAASVETTLELNPSTTEIDRLPGFREAGINRLSIGIQSFDDLQLKRLGRAHTAATARETLRAVRSAGFENISLDLIFAGPQQTTAGVERDLDELIEWSPEHLSTYELSYEPQTPFGRALAAGKLSAADEDLCVEMTRTIEVRLEAAGFERYEISSYARPGRRSRHNARYWQRLSVLGLGMGAHSTEARRAQRPHGSRRANPPRLTEWLAAVEAGESVAVEESLSVGSARGEAVFLALRQRQGLSAGAFEAEFGAAPRSFFAAEIDDLVSRGWLAEGDPAAGDLRLTTAGRLLADSVAAAFVEVSD